jgi:hypothetical protein
LREFINTNVLWIAPIFSFIVAQLMKYVVYAVQYKVLRKERLTGAGGMPSSHSSGVCTLMVVMGVTQGADSAVFALSLVFGLVVMYDAAGVRRAAGLHAKVINVLRKSIDELDKPDFEKSEEAERLSDTHYNPVDVPQKDLKEFVGHTPLEVVCGAIVGVALGLMFVL